MPRFNINKIRSAGLRYIVADADGQAWAFEVMPVRKDNHWRLADKHLCPPHYGEEYLAHWSEVMYWRIKGREFCMPLSDLPFSISWNDEPYDIVEHGLVVEGDIKVWPTFSVNRT